MQKSLYDIAIIGGGINGCGIARDAAGRGLSVLVCEQDDLASGTSSASTKLIHGGLRYLEYYEFRLVREALKEREVLLRAAPHIIWPLRFILPHHKGLRSAWLIRLGLFLYDNLGGRELLPGTTSVNLLNDEAGKPLKKMFTKGFEYSDCWVMDSRLVVLNAMDAVKRGADVLVRTRCTSAERSADNWTLHLEDTTTGEESEAKARILVNATGPWLDDFLDHVTHEETKESIRMVKGSHIIVKKMFEHDRSYIFQNDDGRITFAIPYERDFTLIGTTDVDYTGDPSKVEITAEEIEYLCDAASEYFSRGITPNDVVHTYSGIRPLFDDGASDAKAATRDYILKLDKGRNDQAPLLSIYGGKITTYRKLSESVLEKLYSYLPLAAHKKWTESPSLPGGEFSANDFDLEVKNLQKRFPFIDSRFAYRLMRTYGKNAEMLLNGSKDKDNLGTCFGSNLYEKEVRYLMVNEWAQTADDVLWRRTNMGLFLSRQEAAFLDQWMSDNRIDS